MKKLQFLLVLCCILTLAIAVTAQVQNGQFTGTITDPSGAAIPGATITVTNIATNLKVSTATNATGVYAARDLPPATYKITVEAKGFKTVSALNVVLNVGVNQRQDFKLQLGETREVIEVSGEAPAVNSEDSKIATSINAQQIENLPLNGRNVYDLMQQAPGAVNVDGVLTENGHNTVVNGLRENFNGFLINGSSNKGLSGGPVNTPIEDTVQEFQLLTLKNSAEYGNSAGATTNLVQKSGTNAFHGTASEYIRNDAFDANSFFNNQNSVKKPALHFNQFGGTIGGPIIKDKLFFFGAYQGDRFTTSTLPADAFVEGPEFRAAVESALPNSVAALLYKNFPVPSALQGTVVETVDSYLAGGNSGSGLGGTGTYAGDKAQFEDPTNYGDSGAIAARMTALFNALPAGTPFIYQTVTKSPSHAQGNLFDGNEASLRVDYQAGSKDRLFAQFNWSRSNDTLPATSGLRGFTNPTRFIAPNGQIEWDHTFGPHVVNTARGGYSGNISHYIPSVPGVPSIYIGDGYSTMGFGSYNGYPQFFKENIYNYSDTLSISHGSHNFKMGGEIRRNIENSEFNVARPSYYFYDPFYFAAGAPYGMAAGVDPGFVSKAPAQLASNFRHWRNIEFGAFFQDDWKVSKKLTLQLGIRYDLFARHSEENNLATTFILGPGTNLIDNITTGAGQIRDANVPGNICTPANPDGIHTATQLAVLAGECGPGGFAAAKSLGKGDHNNWGPQVGFAYDLFGNGKTALRGGFGVSYEGTLYNPLSNSRWNPPYYSFNSEQDFATGTGCDKVTGCLVPFGPQSGGAPSYTGPPDPANHQGTDLKYTAIGNIMGWNPNNGDQANLTGIIFPQGIRDPYVFNTHFGIQHEIAPHLVLEANYVGTAGHKMFRAQNVNRIPGGSLAAGTCVTDNFGRQLCSQKSANNGTGRLNPNYGRLRVWENVVNSNYNALQLSLTRQMSRGIQAAFHYTYGHSIDSGSTWHSGATSSNHEGAGEGYSTDVTMPQLDRGNSIYDMRHTLTANYVWELPFFKNSSHMMKSILGGWQLNGTVTYHTGAHWEPFCHGSRGTCDFNNDYEANDRPNSSVKSFSGANHAMWATGWATADPNWCFGAGCIFTRPAAGNVGNLGRNTFTGPGNMEWNPSLSKTFQITERVKFDFRTEAFNVLNHTNFKLPGAQGSFFDSIRSANFGQAGGTFNPRNLQFGFKLTF
jgi:outer membrane receptor protein involved in Fe transport